MYKEEIYKIASLKTSILGAKNKLSQLGSKVKGAASKAYKSRPVQNVRGSVENQAAAGAAKGGIKGAWRGLKSGLGMNPKRIKIDRSAATPLAIGATGIAGAHAHKKRGQYDLRARRYEAKQEARAAKSDPAAKYGYKKSMGLADARLKSQKLRQKFKNQQSSK